MRLDCSCCHARDFRNLVNGIAVDELQCDTGALLVAKSPKGIVDVKLHVGIAIVCVMAYGFRRVDVVGRAQPSVIIVEHIAGYAVEPCGECSLPAKLPDVDIGLE